MSTFKFSILPLFVLVFSLISFSTTYASNPMIVNEPAPALLMSRGVQITSPAPNLLYLTNVPLTIAAAADNSAADLAKLTILVNGQPVAAVTSPAAAATYTPTSAGTYTVTAVASYADFSYVVDTMTFTVRTGGIRQLLVPIPVITP